MVFFFKRRIDSHLADPSILINIPIVSLITYLILDSLTAALINILIYPFFFPNQERKPMSSNSSPNHSHSPDVSSRIIDDETQEAERAESLNEKLVLATSSNDSSPQHDQSMKPEVYQSPLPEVTPNMMNDDVQDSVKNLNEKVSPKVKDDDVQDSVKSLNEKLSAALLTINAKEDLVKQHTRVAEEAVAGIYIFFPVELK